MINCICFNLILGVDVQRFTQDSEYKHETILGLAMWVDWFSKNQNCQPYLILQKTPWKSTNLNYDIWQSPWLAKLIYVACNFLNIPLWRYNIPNFHRFHNIKIGHSTIACYAIRNMETILYKIARCFATPELHFLFLNISIIHISGVFCKMYQCKCCIWSIRKREIECAWLQIE